MYPSELVLPNTKSPSKRKNGEILQAIRAQCTQYWSKQWDTNGEEDDTGLLPLLHSIDHEDTFCYAEYVSAEWTSSDLELLGQIDNHVRQAAEAAIVGVRKKWKRLVPTMQREAFISSLVESFLVEIFSVEDCPVTAFLSPQYPVPDPNKSKCRGQDPSVDWIITFRYS
jgi:hypothetical protein